MKIIKFLIINFIFFIVFFSSSPSVLSSYTKYSTSPLLHTSNSITWDNYQLYGPSIVFDNSVYKIWYTGSNNFRRQIGYATSFDIFSITNYANNPIIRWDIISTNDVGIEHPSVIVTTENDDVIYKIWFNNAEFNLQNFNLFTSHSSDGLSWSSPIKLSFNNERQAWEKDGVGAPSVVYNKQNNKYLLWYVAKGSLNNVTRWRIGYAYSDDGIHWTKHPSPILEPTQNWEGYDIGNPSVLLEDGIYHMWYHGNGGIGHATSLDGITWEKDVDNPILKPGPSVWESRRLLNPFVLKKDGIYYLWYTGEGPDGRWQIGLATSEPIPTINISPTLSPFPTATVTITPSITPSTTGTITPAFTPTVSPVITITPTPPRDSSKDPVILIPGFGASWDLRSLYSCNLEKSSNWKLAPYVSVYRRLINTLTQNARLKLNKDFYFYAYDWRQDLDQQAVDFTDYLNNILKDKPSGTKFRLIGHSMGGLIIRSYLTHNPNSHMVSKALTIGTPHQGSVFAYPAWEKGEVWTNNNLIRIALSQLINYCKFVRSDISLRRTAPFIRIRGEREIVQMISPSVRNLLPVFDFIRYNGKTVKTENLVNQNTWVNTHPFPDDLFQTDFGTISGKEISTLRYLDVTYPDGEKQTSGDWIDGKPINQESITQGDGTVLALSSEVKGAVNKYLEGDHSSIIASSEAIESILDFLQMKTVQVALAVPLPEITSNNYLIFSTDNETKLEVTSFGREKIANEDGIFVDYSPKIGLYQISILPKETKLSSFYVTRVNNNNAPDSIYFDFQAKKNSLNKFLVIHNPIRPLQIIPIE